MGNLQPCSAILWFISVSVKSKAFWFRLRRILLISSSSNRYKGNFKLSIYPGFLYIRRGGKSFSFSSNFLKADPEKA